MKPKISVIMPCLNMAAYIKECMDSVICQTMEDIEILVVDAGSVDGTLDLLRNYEERDNRIRIISSERQSYGYQVNLGIAASLGEYMAIVDTDDRIVPDMFYTLYPVAEETGADYVKGTAEMFYTVPGGYVVKYPLMQFPVEKYTKEERIEVCPRQLPELLSMDNFLWYGIYRRDFLKKIRLHESDGAAFQDLGGLLQTQMNAQKAVYVSKPVYEYRQDNAQSSVYNKKSLQFVAEEYRWARQFVYGQTLEWKASFYRKLFLHTSERFHAMAVSGEFWNESGAGIADIVQLIEKARESSVITESEFTTDQWEEVRLFCQKPELLYEKYLCFYKQKKKELQELIYEPDNEHTVIFGCGVQGQYLYAQFLTHSSRRVAAWCDNQKSLQGETFMGAPVLPPERAAAQYPEALYVIASKKYACDMRIQLLESGIPDENIRIYEAYINVKLLQADLF